jgi:hypothetical protein
MHTQMCIYTLYTYIYKCIYIHIYCLGADMNGMSQEFSTQNKESGNGGDIDVSEIVRKSLLNFQQNSAEVNLRICINVFIYIYIYAYIHIYM